MSYFIVAMAASINRDGLVKLDDRWYKRVIPTDVRLGVSYRLRTTTSALRDMTRSK
jgi:hypothetical protein